MTKTQARKLIEQEKITFIYLQFTDLLGTIKTVIVSSNRFLDTLDTGIWFDGSSVEGFARIAESDMMLKPDLNTLVIIPWSKKSRRAARIICNIYLPSGRRLVSDPRSILQKVLERAKKQGLSFFTAAETEFYLIEREALPAIKPHDYKSYFDYTPHSRASEICERTMKSLNHFGIKGEMHHHEVGKGQHEIGISYDEALKSADNILALKTALKAYTSSTELKVTWMPKPIYGSAGNGLHVHQSLWKNGQNIFYDPKNKYGLSKTALHFLAGQLAHAKALSAVVSPTVNSYKRLVSGFEAPVYICWARTNRSTLIRIPNSPPQTAAKSVRLEYRAPDPSANPYLVFAALLAAGLDGIQRKLEAPPAVERNVYHFKPGQLAKNNIGLLPKTLGEALDAFEQDKVIAGIFGSAKDTFLQIKRKEWEQFLPQVTKWEIKKYL